MANTVRIIRLVRRLPARSNTMRATRGSAGGSRRTGRAPAAGATRGSAMRTCAGRGRTGGGSAGCASAMRTCAGSACRGGTSGASAVGAGGGSARRGRTMRTCAGRGCTGGRSATRGGTGGRSASRGSAMRARAGRGRTGGGCAGCASTMRTCAGSAVCARTGRRSSGCAVGSAASAVGGAAGIRIHERVVVSAVRRAGSSVRGSRVPGGASIAGCGRMRRRGGLSRTRHAVGAVAWIRGRKS